MNTDYFEVHCFYQLSILKKISIKNSDSIVKTNHFLAGGYDIKRKKGIIKLYTIIKRKDKNFEIEKVQDIILKKNNIFKGFNGAISCIEEQKAYNKLLITCWDGSIYLFDKPDLEKEFYLKKDYSMKKFFSDNQTKEN